MNPDEKFLIMPWAAHPIFRAIAHTLMRLCGLNHVSVTIVFHGAGTQLGPLYTQITGYPGIYPMAQTEAIMG